MALDLGPDGFLEGQVLGPLFLDDVGVGDGGGKGVRCFDLARALRGQVAEAILDVRIEIGAGVEYGDVDR